MYALLSGPLAPVVATALACFAAWKAAELLEADNLLAAVGVGAVLALVGPYLTSEQIISAFAELSPPTGTKESMAVMSQFGMGLARMAFALVGVLAWCGIERAG